MGDYMNYILIISRFAAFLLDYIVLYGSLYFLSRYSTTGYVIALVIFFLYRYLTTAILGATVGMLLLKIRLISYSHRICLKREIYRFASALFFLGYIYALFNKKHQTFHDNASGTYVVFSKSKDEGKEKLEKKRFVTMMSTLLLAISATRWLSFMVLNDFGLIGLKRVYESEQYYQSFEGDNLLSISQDELYMKTLGRKYITVVDMEGKPTLIRISNKLKYTEIYKLNLSGDKIIGDYIYTVNMPILFVCSGNFRGKVDMCGVSPQNKVVLVDEKGNIYGEGQSNLGSILTLRCGDIDQDGRDEAVILGRGGDVEIFKLQGDKFQTIYSGKMGEDIIPESFYVDKGMVVVGKSHEKKLLYFYDFKNNKFVFRDKKHFKVDAVSSVAKINEGIIVSHVFRNSMTFKKGRIQLLEIYGIEDGVKRVYNLGKRPGRSYSYMVRTLEDVIDIDGDGTEEIILKAVGKEDVMGQGYIVEIYRESKGWMTLNRVLTKLEDILH